MDASICVLENEIWYQKLDANAKHAVDLIFKYHKYFSDQDRKYKHIVYTFRLIILFLSMLSTIILGLKTIINIDVQVMIGLILSSVISFLTAIIGYFNFEEYWMRNITIHIRLNILRDDIVFDAASETLVDQRLTHYMNELEKIQQDNINYWKKAIKKM